MPNGVASPVVFYCYVFLEVLQGVAEIKWRPWSQPERILDLTGLQDAPRGRGGGQGCGEDTGGLGMEADLSQSPSFCWNLESRWVVGGKLHWPPRGGWCERGARQSPRPNPGQFFVT